MTAVLKYSSTSGLFGLMRSFDIRKKARQTGFTWDPRGFWKTESPFRALCFSEYADESARNVLGPYMRAVADSRATNSIVPIPAPDGLEYMPFQKAGIIYAARRKHTMFGDEPGLGKTIQAIGLANYLGLKRLLVICPAGLRLNWVREIEKWHLHSPGVEAILNGCDRVPTGKTVVISYDLARRLKMPAEPFDLVIADEAHYLKNRKAERTKRVLGRKGNPGLVGTATRKLVLTGIPMPNRVNEVYPIIRRLAPQVIDGMSYHKFLDYYATYFEGDYGTQVTGIQHEEELNKRLRAFFMVRRLKSEVLKDLPAKQYKMVVFPAEGSAMRKVLFREKQFSAEEILKHGAPVGSALPEIRHEMGVAKAPLVVNYVKDVLEDGLPKVVIYAHHRDVVEILRRGLGGYGVVTVTGNTSPLGRQAAVDAFQNDLGIQVFAGNIVAGGVGVTLTAAKDVVFAEASWVPGENEQAEDRVHRIGQHDGVLIHVLVVEGSLDARILGSAARKRADITKVIDGGN